MLTTQTRLRVEYICTRIAAGAEVDLKEMAWLQKLANVNPSVATMLRRARRQAINGDAAEDSLDGFMSALDLGDPDPSNHLSGPQDPTTLAEWFSAKQAWFRGQL